MKRERLTQLTGMLLMAFSVAMGAFGAHAWKVKLAETGRTDTYELGIRYLMFHALALILLGLLMERFPKLFLAVVFLVFGILFFSGSLMVLALANEGRWGAVAPVGGTFLILGWLTAAWTVYRSGKADH